MERVIERASDGAIERAIERAMERAIERSSGNSSRGDDVVKCRNERSPACDAEARNPQFATPLVPQMGVMRKSLRKFDCSDSLPARRLATALLTPKL